jgi:hypothetical protein
MSLNEDVPIKEAYPRRKSRTAAPLLTRNSLGGGLKAPVHQQKCGEIGLDGKHLNGTG